MQDSGKITSTDGLVSEFAAAFIPSNGEAPADGLGAGGDGGSDSTGTNRESDPAQRATAADIIRDIGRDFVRLRQDGRSQAWADLEDRLMTHAHDLIAAGLMTPKDWIGLAIDIEQFRKQEQGSHIPPGDFLSKWLSAPSESAPAPPSRALHAPKKADRIEKKRRDAVAKSRSREETA